MGVKDLVKLYDPPSSNRDPAGTTPASQGVGVPSPLGSSQLVGDSSDGSLPLPPRPARFLKKEDFKANGKATQQGDGSELKTVTTKATVASSGSIAWGSQSTLRHPLSQSFGHDTLRTSRPFGGRAMDTSSTATTTTFLSHTYPPTTPTGIVSSNGIPLNDLSDTTSAYERRHPHKPIPATVLFARDAAPLHLPRLDAYLSTIPLPGFKESPGSMFPPMDRLKKLNMSLDDLENNAKATPGWRNRKNILGATLNALIGFLGSSALASFYSLQGLINTLQVFALILSTIIPTGGVHVQDSWRKLFLGTIPNILAFNFASIVTQSLILLVVFMVVSGSLLFYFYRSATRSDRYNSIEGLQQTETQGNQWGLVIVTFLLTVVYLPLSTMAVHVLVWSEELWPIENPYVNATSFPPVVLPLGPPNEFRDPLDFCWTTTMKRNEVNFALIMVTMALFTVVLVGFWFPLALRRVIRQSVPKVDKFTELGNKRTDAEMDREYHRLLSRDRNPFAFLYNGFRRDWGTYISTYLFAKLSTLFIIAIVSPENCLFRSFPRVKVAIARQVLLLVSTVGFFAAQCVFAPFLDPVNNASEWTSRLNYLTTSITALLVTINIPGKEIIESYVLYSIYIITYGLGFYFTIINFTYVQKIVKRFNRRIDFSVDIFSPRLDITPSSNHTKRRIWQESITTLLLTDPDCKIPREQTMTFAQARDSEFPPYLLNFAGSPGERHVENVKILREVGSMTYNRAVALLTGPDFYWFRYLQDEIQKNYVGPDSYWKRMDGDEHPHCTSYFGNAWWIPFPPALVLRYDNGTQAVLTAITDLEQYVKQNSSRMVQLKRHIRMSLRALEGKVVRWPYDHIQHVGSHSTWCCSSRRRYNAVETTSYDWGLLRIKRRGHLWWRGLALGSGFEVTLKYSRSVQVSSDVIGLNEDFDLTPTLARFLELNKDLIDEEIYAIEEVISHYRRYHRKECKWKTRTLTYRFLTTVYNSPMNSAHGLEDEAYHRAQMTPDTPTTPAVGTSISQSCLEFEVDGRVRTLMSCSDEVFHSARTRLEVVSRSEAATWWYIFWDDLWRRNHDTIPGLERHEADFNPHYVSSIAYTPLPRPALEAFLTQRGLLHKKPKWWDTFHAGFLNKLYLRLNDTVFRDSNKAIMFHLGNDRREFDMEDIDILTQGQSSTLGTGAGTDHDNSGFIPRPTYRWEGLLNDPPRGGGRESRTKWLTKIGAWFGVTPLWRAGFLSNGISLDVRLDEKGRYVLLHSGSSASGRTSEAAVRTASRRT